MTDWQYNEYDTQRVGWKYAEWAIVAPAAYKAFRIGIQYARNTGTAMFTNVFAHREEFGQSYTYDENKNVIATAVLSTQNSAMTYDAEDNLISYRQPGAASSDKYTMSYGSNNTERKKHLLRNSTTPEGQRDVYTYDDYGNQLTATRQKSGGTQFIKTTAAYTSDGAFPTASTDARGKTVTRAYNTTTGTVSTVTDPDGICAEYFYTPAKQLNGVRVIADDKRYWNTYSYRNDRLEWLKHNTTEDGVSDVTYYFGYDLLGRRTTVHVGTDSDKQLLSTNVYRDDRSGLLAEMQYGNGDSVAYRYDDFNRLTGVRFDGASSDRYTYEYGADGSASVVRDASLGRVLQTETDLTGRPMSTQLRTSNGSLLYRTALNYDTQNRLTGFAEQVGAETYKTAYTYDKDNRPKTVAFDGDTDAVGYTYDELGRVATSTNGPVTSTYSYAAGGQGANSTTGMVSAISRSVLPISYTYDNRGNIASETCDGETTTYSYDGIGQLIQVDAPHEDTTWKYYYDRGGNIEKKERYNSSGVLQQTINYGYNTTNWKDKLISYNGQTITYDAIGNPLSDSTWEYTWQAGRQLQKMQNRATVEFQYDHSGLRVQKKVDDLITNYTLHGKLITHLTQGTNQLHFFYDAQSRPA